MSDKLQHTTASMRIKMIAKYGTEHHHKHDKLHSPYRLHWKSHPVQKINVAGVEMKVKEPSEFVPDFNVHVQKTRIRLRRGSYH